MKYVLIFSDGESIEAETCETRKEAHEKMVKSYEEYYPEDQNKPGQICLISEKNLHCCT